MKDDQLDSQNKNNKRPKREESSASSSENSDSGNPLTFSKRSRKQFDSSSEDETTDSEVEEEATVPHTQRRATPNSSSEDETTDSEVEEEATVLRNRRRATRVIVSDNESGDRVASVNGNNVCSTESFESLPDDQDSATKQDKTDTKTQDDAAVGRLSDSDSQNDNDSDSQYEKCPICLAKFNDSVTIGSPDPCDHCFCVVCLHEWAKNKNTCPIDRQPFTLINIRQHSNGKVIPLKPGTRVSVELLPQPTDDQAISDDATFCEVCRLGDREDRMLLCDTCDNGYHMECLNPPLLHVPIEEWHCPECTPGHTLESHALNQNLVGSNETSPTSSVSQSRTRPATRVLPRTRQYEQVQRSLRSRRQVDIQQSPSTSGIDVNATRRTQVYQRGATRKIKKYKRKPRDRIKRIVTDDGVIEVRLKRKKKGKYKKKRKSRTLKSIPRTVKSRLANRLGICAPLMKTQIIPDTVNRPEVSNAPINHQRHQAGIPTLDIFGRRDQLDYFSGSDQEEDVEFEGGFGVISRVRVTRPSDRFISRKKAATVLSSIFHRKPQKVENESLPADGSLLDSILNSQTLWHSKKSEIKSNPDGSLHVALPKFSKNCVVKEDDKIDVRKASAPVTETPMFPGGRSSGTFEQDRGTSNQINAQNNSERSYEASGHQPSGSTSSGYPSYSSSAGISPLRGAAPIRFRMNAPPRRPNIHSYPSDNIPPPPPMRLRYPMAEMTITETHSPDVTPPREEEEIDIYSDIEQDNNSNEHEEKSFGTLEPPPEPPFLMSMEPPPEPPAILMNLNEDASDDEASGLVIDDPPTSDVYDPCAINSDESSTEDTPLAKPPELPMGLKDSELVADYSSGSQSGSLTPSYNPELPTFLNTPIIGPLPQPPSHNSSDENDEDCPNFSMYSVASMTLAQRGLPPLPVTNLDIPIPPPPMETVQVDIDVPLPENDSLKSKENRKNHDLLLSQSENTFESIKCHNEDSNSSIIDDKENDSEAESILDKEPNKMNSCNLNTVEEDGDDEEEDDDDEEVQVKRFIVDSNNHQLEKESSVHNVNENVQMEKTKIKEGLSEVAEDECSTQGDVLDLVIESENNLEQNIPHDDNEKLSEQGKSPIEMDENDEKNVDGGDKSDGLVDITDEDMSVYDGQDNNEDLDRFDGSDGMIDKNKHDRRSLDSDDDNSLVGGATSAISAGTINNSDNAQPHTLPGLEGLETETISESEDVNFDELPLEENEQIEALLTEEDHITSRKKKKKKNRKMSHTEDVNLGIKEPLEFEEGEIVDDKPKQSIKKDKKIKSKSDNITEVGDIIESNKTKGPNTEKDVGEKKVKKKKDKNISNKDKTEKNKEPREKTIKPGEVDENIAWKKLSKSNKERNYREKEKDGKEKDEKERDRENKNDNLSKKEKRNKEKRKELERYNVRRLISEKPKRPKKDEFGRDISPSKSGSSLSPYRPPRYRSPLRTRNRSRTRSRSYKSRSRSRERRRRSRSRDRARSRDRSRRLQSKEISRRRSRSQNNLSRSKDPRKTPEYIHKSKNVNRSTSRTRRTSRSRSVHSRRRSLSYSKSWTPSWSRSSKSRSLSRRRQSRSISRSKSRSWTRDKNISSIQKTRAKAPPKNLTVIVTNKDALKKKDKKKLSKKKDDRRKKKRNSPAPSKEVFTSGDNILVSVNFKNGNKNLEPVITTGTPLLRESSKRKRDDVDGSAKKKRNTNSKKSPGAKKSSRLSRINEVARNAKPVAIIDLDLSPFREQTPSPKEVIILSDSGDEGDKQHSQLQDEMNGLGHNSMSQSMLSLSSNDHKQKNSVSQPQSPISSSFILNSSGPKTPPEPHIKFSISTKPTQIRMLSNPLMEAEEEMPDESIENDINEKLHKGPNTPPEPPPDLNTPASPPTTPYDPFDPTKSRSPSPQLRSNEIGSQLNSIREDKSDNMQKDDDDDHSHLAELHSLTPPIESEDVKQTPESAKIHSTPKSDPNNTDSSPKVSPSAGSSELTKVSEDTLMKPVQKLTSTNKLDVTVHKSPEKLITLVISQPVKILNQTPKQAIQPLKNITPVKHSTPKGNAKHQLFSSSLMKQVPMLSSLLPGQTVYTPTSLASGNKTGNRAQQNGDPSDDMDIDLGSPYSPGSSEGDDLFEPPIATPPRNSAKPVTRTKTSSSNKFDTIFGSSPAKLRHGKHSSKTSKKGSKSKSKGNKKEDIKVKLDEDQLKILDELPSSAVEMQFLKKLNRQERVVEEVKLVLKPHYAKKHVNKEEYKEILRRSVPKICHNKSGEINPIKIHSLIEAYVKKFRYSKKKATGSLPASAQNKPKPQKTLWS